MIGVEAKTYRLLKPLLHRGIYHRAGTLLAFDDRRARWLAEQGVISVNGIVARTQTSLPKQAPARRVGGCAGCGR